MSLQALQQAALGLAQGKVTEWLTLQHARPSVRAWLSSCASSRVGSAPSKPCSARTSKPCPSTRSMRSPTGSTRCRSAQCRSSPPAAPARRTVERGRLLARVQGPAAISALLTGIIAVDTLPEALEKRRTLLSGESVITRDGVWIGREWLRVSRDKDVHAGVIGREKEMRSLRDVVAAAEQQRDAIQTQLAECARAARRARAAPRRACRARSIACIASHSELERAGQRAAHEGRADGRARAPHRRRNRGARSRSRESRRAPSRKRAHACRKASMRWRSSKTARIELEQEREELRQNLSFKRSQAQTDRDGAQEVAIKVESKRSALHVDFGGPRAAAPSARAAASSGATS